MGAADLANARHFAQGQGLHKLLDSCGLIIYCPLGLLISDATLASMVLGPNPTLKVS